MDRSSRRLNDDELIGRLVYVYLLYSMSIMEMVRHA